MEGERCLASFALRFHYRSLRCRLARHPGFASFHLTLEPIDLVLDGLPTGFGREPVQRTLTLFLAEHRRSGQPLIERHLLLGWRIGPRPPNGLGPVGGPSDGRRPLTTSGHARRQRKCPGSTGDGTRLRLDDSSLARLACRCHDLRADVAWDQTEARIPRRLHGAVLIPVRIELWSPAGDHFLTL